MSVLWPSKYAKIRFRLGLCSRRSPRLLSRLERGHPSAYPTPLGTDPPSALAMRPPPEVQPDLRLCRQSSQLRCCLLEERRPRTSAHILQTTHRTEFYHLQCKLSTPDKQMRWKQSCHCRKTVLSHLKLNTKNTN